MNHLMIFFSVFFLMVQSTISVPLQQLDVTQAVLESHLSSGPLPSPRPVSLPVQNPTQSFWIDSPGANPLATEGSDGGLTKDADICIVGAGITGVSAAYHLARQLDGNGKSNTTVVILEARDFCSGATGRNGGHLTPSIFLDFHRRQLLYGTEAALKTYDMENYTSRELLKIIRRDGHDGSNPVAGEQDVDLYEGGHVVLFVTQAEEDGARRDFEAAQGAGVDRLNEVQWIDKETMEETRGTSFPGVKMPGHNLWPLKLVTQLYRLSRTHSKNVDVKLHTRTPVTSVDRLSSNDTSETHSHRLQRRYSVRTPRGSLTCSYVLHATNGYVNHLLSPKETQIQVVPTRGQIVGVRAADGQDKVGRTSWDANEGFEYWFPRPLQTQSEARPLVILGGGREVSGPDFEFFETDDGKVNPSVGHALRKFLPDLFPGLYDINGGVEWEWTGIMGYTQSGNPFVGYPLHFVVNPVLIPHEVGPVLPHDTLTSSVAVGRSHPALHDFEGQYVAAGYTGHGMPRAYACAEVVAGMIVADIENRAWTTPAWFPDHYLTTSLST